MAAWFALTEGRYHDVADYAQAGQQHAGLTNAMIQLVLQQARGQARLSQRRDVHASPDHGAKLLEQLPKPDHPENHFVFDHTKWIFYAATCYTGLGDDEPAEEHARELIGYHTRPDGTSNAPMRTAMSRRHRCAAPRPAIAPGLRPLGRPRPARAGPHALSSPLICWAHPATRPALHGAVFLGGLIVPLPAAASRSLPAVASHAIGFAEPRHNVHSPGIGAYRGRWREVATPRTPASLRRRGRFTAPGRGDSADQ